MRNGFQKINFLINLILFSTFAHILLAEDIQLGPLINLDQIEPSYEFFDETIIQNGTEDDSSTIITNNNEKEINFASLSVLNKITANVEKLDIKLKKNFNHGELRIYPIDCYLSNPEEKSETAVYLNIYHNSKDQKIFSGWMLKSLPSISAIEHPIYDIWVNDCY